MLSFAGQTSRVVEATGLHDIARLLNVPGRESHVLDLLQRAPEIGQHTRALPPGECWRAD